MKTKRSGLKVVIKQGIANKMGGWIFCSPQNLSMVSLIVGAFLLCSACLEAERLTARKAGRNLTALSERRLASARSKCQSLIDLNRIQTRSDFLRSKIT
jgi:hypothetical protein